MKKRLFKASSFMLAIVLCFSLFLQDAFAFGYADTVGEVSLTELKNICFTLNANPLGGMKFTLIKDSKTSRWRIMDGATGAWVVNVKGEYAYTPYAGDAPEEPGNAPATVPGPPAITTNKWVKYDTFPPPGVQLSMTAKSSLGDAVMVMNDVPYNEGCTLSASGDYWVITKTVGRSTYFFCDKSGRPYVASKTPAAADQEFEYIVNNSGGNNQTVVSNKPIDTVNNTMTIIDENGDKVTLNIDSLYWDDSTNSYTANTYNIENNTYNYYTYNISYNITNTYITYIGSNGAYQQEEYKYYYELPDGRSSEDLTAEEVGAMSFQFADVTNYARSATDTSLRALYHFDGNTEDSGYFSTQTKFKWDTGASITYMDSAGFNGALYLDELAHGFDIDLPSNLGSGDFSVQFRHYQASQPDTVDNKNNMLALGGVTVLRWDERSFYWNGSSTPCASVPVGSWHELALIRDNGTLYFYINGVKVASKADTTAYQGKLMFSLGPTSRAYTMLDELRVVNFPVAKAGASYQCATVPYDTNLVLVLPDSAFPIADEYWKFNTTGNVLSGYDFTSGALSLPTGWSSNRNAAVSYFSNSVSLTGNSNSGQANGFCAIESFPAIGSYLGNLAMSVMTSDGVVRSATCLLSKDGSAFRFNGGQTAYVVNFDTFSVSFRLRDGGTRVVVLIEPFNGKSVDIIYTEFILGSAPNTGHEKISCIYSSEDIKPNTAAVQSAIPVNGYTVGGVRPTFPARGDVWFPVEGRRITGCYQYDGSMWRSAGCRYYTGTRWIPIYAFDIYTLADCWDVADAGDIDSTPPITSESGFWNWWKGQWGDFRKWMEQNKGGGSGGGDSIVIPDGTLPNLPGSGEGGEEDDGFSIVDIVKGIVDNLWKLVKGLFSTIFGGVLQFFLSLGSNIDGFFSAFDGDKGVFGFAKYGGADIWD